MLANIQSEILRLKKEKGICILSHWYQSPQIVEIADVTEDSFALAQKATLVKIKTVVMCGVRFMAETVNIDCNRYMKFSKLF